MKKILIASIFALAVLALAPRFIGATAEDKIRDLYLQANQHANVNFEIVEYNRGWFSSDLKVELKFVSPGVPQSERFDFTVIHHMQHGPLLWKTAGLGVGLVDTVYGIELPPKAQADIQQYQNVMNATSRMSFDGSSQSTVKINPFSYDDEGTTIDVRSGEFESRLEMPARLTLDGNWKGITITDQDNSKVQLVDLSIQMEQTSINGEFFGAKALFEGDMQMVFENIHISGDNPVIIENFSTLSSNKFRDDVVDYSVVFGIDKLSAIGQEFSDVAYSISMESFSTEVILRMQEIMGENNSSDPTAILQNFQELLPKLIERNPVIKVDRFGMNTAAGKMESSVTISVAQEKYDANNPMSLMMAIDAVASGYAPESFFNDLGMVSEINSYVQQNLLIRDGDQLRFNASFKDGQVLLNGAAIPLGI